MWTAALDGGPRRVNHAAARIGDYIYSFGGYSTTDILLDWDPIQVHILNTRTLRWQPGPSYSIESAPYHRYGHSVVAYKDKIYLWGGRNNSEAFDTICCFNTNTLTWTYTDAHGMIPLAKDGHSACVVDNKMYIFGGFEYLTNQYSQEVHYYDFANFEWVLVKAKGDLPIHRDFHTAIGVGDKMYVWGGRGDLMLQNYEAEIYCQNLHVFNTVTETWQKPNVKGKGPRGRRSHSAWYYKGYMYIFGGYNSNEGTHFNDLYRISLENFEWEPVRIQGKGPCVRRRQCCIIYEDRLFLFGGTSPHLRDCQYIDDEKTIDNNDLYVLDFNASLKTLCILKVLENEIKFDLQDIPHSIQDEIIIMTTPNKISGPMTSDYDYEYDQDYEDQDDIDNEYEDGI